jgi:hypothetical protein
LSRADHGGGPSDRADDDGQPDPVARRALAAERGLVDPTLDRDRPTSAFGGWSERLALRGAADQQRLTAGGGNGPPPSRRGALIRVARQPSPARVTVACIGPRAFASVAGVRRCSQQRSHRRSVGGRVALVTGVSGGIGLSMARRFAETVLVVVAPP